MQSRAFVSRSGCFECCPDQFSCLWDGADAYVPAACSDIQRPKCTSDVLLNQLSLLLQSRLCVSPLFHCFAMSIAHHKTSNLVCFATDYPLIKTHSPCSISGMTCVKAIESCATPLLDCLTVLSTTVMTPGIDAAFQTFHTPRAVALATSQRQRLRAASGHRDVCDDN